MQLFITDEEFESLRSDDDNVTFIVSKVDSFITNLQQQLETVKAQSEASSITAEQTCSLLKQKCISLSSDKENIEAQNAELNAAIERILEELGVVKSEMHRIRLESVNLIEAAALKQSQLHEREAECSHATCTQLSQRDAYIFLFERLSSFHSLKLLDSSTFLVVHLLALRVQTSLDVDSSVPRC